MWHTEKFDELTNTEMFQIYELRTAVFVVEQKRIYQEVDRNDLKAIHIFKTNPAGKIVAYARIFPQQGHVTFGRVVTRGEYRGQGLGNELIEKVIEAIHSNYPGMPIEIEAQAQVEGFYEKFLFEPIVAPFIFESTPHVKMVHKAV
ncbi:GNAT family N-acetyltransferase [Lentilactobacillus parakefiri]|uniref:GNAT family N-acetyltransferase n=1 Tax=Lentilactobacillus parakefiri TaxID=152332 RepID=A0A269Y2J4_9LACO|nr:GNAT family N-acetyltransferase [Lentilactobacillus parakefiri]PAK79773.1 GNAT family N-acetyltransferase [Lentilactobacillus parakefiri]